MTAKYTIEDDGIFVMETVDVIRKQWASVSRGEIKVLCDFVTEIIFANQYNVTCKTDL